MPKFYSPTMTQIRSSVYYAPRPRYRFPRKVLAILAICFGVLFVGVAYAWFV